MRALSFFVGIIAITAACGGSTFTSVADGGSTDGSSSDGSSSDGASSDGSVADGGGPDSGLALEGGGGGQCTGDQAAIFSNVIKGCMGGAPSCAVVFHQIDCCGSLAAIGINHASRSAFDADETTWRMTCPACGCSPRTTIAEDGRSSGNMSNFMVACVNGECRSYLP